MTRSEEAAMKVKTRVKSGIRRLQQEFEAELATL
jgi:hypothetical protein